MKNLINFIVMIITLIMMSACGNNRPTQTPRDNSSAIATVVAATLSAYPSATPLPTLTDIPVPTATTTAIAPSEPLRRSDFLSVVKWVSFSISQNQPSLIVDVIGRNGVNWAKYRSGFSYLGYNNAELFVAELENGIQGVSPQCLGYEYSVGTLPDKGSIIYRNINLDWNKLFGLEIVIPEEGDMISFGFQRLEDSWELVYVTFLREALWNELSTKLSECP